MISMDLRTHVVDWKKTFHPFPNRQLTDNEWIAIRSLPKLCRFVNGEEVEPGKFFWAYFRNGANGMWITTSDKIISSREASKRRSQSNPEQKNARSRARYRSDRERVIKRTSEYSKKNRDRGRVVNEMWRRANPDKLRRYYKTEWEKQKTVPQKRIARLLRMRIKGALRGKILYDRDSDYESVSFLIWLADRQNIDHTNGYDIDHLIPLSKLDLSTPEQQLAANSPANVRWLKSIDNIRKHAKMPTQLEIDDHLALVAIWHREGIVR